MRDMQLPRPDVGRAHQPSVVQVSTSDDRRLVDAGQLEAHANPSRLIQVVQRVRSLPKAPRAPRDDSRRRAGDHYSHDGSYTQTAVDEMLAPSAAELISISPRRELRALGLPNSHQLEPLAQSSKADVVGRHPQSGPRVGSLALLDRFPSLLERRQVPALAHPTDDPQTPFRGVVGEPAADWEVLERLVTTEIVITEEAGGVHR